MSEPALQGLPDGWTVFRRSRKMDLVYKMLLAEAWLSGDAERMKRAETDYLEMQRARFGFFENTPRRTKPADFIAAFRRTAESIRARGFAPEADPVHLEEGTMELVDGHHRLACCLVFGIPCRFAFQPPRNPGRIPISTFRTFRFGGMAESVLRRGIRAYLRLNERARLMEFPTRLSEERAIAEFERARDCVVWHSSPRSGGFLFVASFPSGVPSDAPSSEASRALAEELFAEVEDPDWRARAEERKPLARKLRMLRLRYELTLPFRFGKRREKAKWHIAELGCRERAETMLADYVTGGGR